VPPVVASCCVISGAYVSQGVGRLRNSHRTARTLLTMCQELSSSYWITPLFQAIAGKQTSWLAQSVDYQLRSCSDAHEFISDSTLEQTCTLISGSSE